MKKTVVFVMSLLFLLSAKAQEDSKTIATINNAKITVGEFKKVYEKNLSAIDNKEGKDVAKNLDLYINYKLKVEEAYQSNLDTLRSYKREIQTYKNQLIAPYLQDKSYFNDLVIEAYDRTKNQVRASHILIRLPKNPSPQDTLKAYNKILQARKRVLNGEAFDVVAKEMSQDPSAKENGGDLGYFSAFQMIYDFEDRAFKTKKGEVSEVFNTRFGYHILTNTGFRASLGEREVAHILINDTTALGKTKIDAIYADLKEGKDFAEMARKHSNDTGSKTRGGKLKRFGTGRMVKSFEEPAFAIQNEGDLSKPIKTKFGWHIIKLIKKYPVGSLEVMKKEITDKVKRSGRGKRSDQIVLKRLKSEYNIIEVASAKAILRRKDIRVIPKDSLQETILKINDREIKQEAFVAYTMNRRHLAMKALFSGFKDQEIIKYFKDNLRFTNKEFGSTLKEYEDGLLLFELMQRKIWNKSNDSLGLQAYFDQNANNYKGKDLSKIKGKVMNDYQAYLEDQWVLELRSSNRVKINKGVLKKLIKFYRKES
jgi:peptidyl-prolyl cis-trans isomerase SurA